jgi:dephospho-CoA kinase
MKQQRDQAKFVVGLTGGIGSGKSTVAEMFTALGVNVVNADTLAREVVEPGQPALHSITARFGAEILQTDGSLDRAALRKIIFSDPEHKNWLESLLHPLINNLLLIRIKESKSTYCILESPLLLETEQHKLVNRVLVIDVQEKTQMSRAALRDGSNKTVIRTIIESQINRKERIQAADDIIDNEQGLGQLQNKVEALHNNYLILANKHDC